MLDRMQTGRWKVFSTCRAWLEERRLYHRKDGVVVKERDDAISASRYAYGKDRSGEIAGIARNYDAALKAIGYGEASSAGAPPILDAAKPAAAEATPARPHSARRGLLEWLLFLFTGGR